MNATKKTYLTCRLFSTFILLAAIFSCQKNQKNLITQNDTVTQEVPSENSTPPKKIVPAVNSTYPMPNDVHSLIPYEIDGKIGFLNEDLNVMFPPQFDDIYQTGKYSMVVACYEKKESMAVVSSLYLLLGTGTQIPFPGSSQRVALIGDGFYAISQTVHTESRSVLYRVTGKIQLEINGVEIYSGQSGILMTVINQLDTSRPRYNCIDQFGTFYFPENDFKRILGFNKEGTRGVVLDSDFDYRIINDSGEFVTDKRRWYLQMFSEGRILGSRENETGIFDEEGSLVVPAVRLPEGNVGFHCNRIPCVFGQDGLILTDTNYTSDNWGLINADGDIIKTNIHATRITEFSDDGTAVLITTTENGLRFNLVNTEGISITQSDFDIIHPSVNGYCRAKKDGVDYIISSYDGSAIDCRSLK